MSTEELEAAYLDAMRRLKGSVLGPQLAAPIENYIERLTALRTEAETEIHALKAQIALLHLLVQGK